MPSPARPRILIVFGTRPEAIKLFPLVHALRRTDTDVRVCVTGQHREMLDQVLEIAQITPDYDLNLMLPNQSLDALTARLLSELGAVMDQDRPDRVIVQGDTATAMVGALAAYYRKLPVGHVEAGLRSGNIYHPWPEEVNRKIVGSIADQHFAPTDTARDALTAENVPADRIYVTGNTVIDALMKTRARVDSDPSLASVVAPIAARFAGKRIVAVTTHRRENFGGGLESVAHAVRRLAARPDVAVIFPVHPNPNVRAPMVEVLGGTDNVALIDPLDYPNFVRLLSLSYFVMTDSGGVQEEAPALAKPVLVMRETTERPEGVAAGTAKLVGNDEETIVTEASRLLDDKTAYEAMARAHNPFGDGKSSERIARIIVESFA
ncbi:non-hydrolyzing UDP-N-acetylglucosamine 2-epimerase [Sphingomonas sp.]|jgi:UDP-N-acetylglucosamine 2-epimerase (non-hydrolysing)|uniref:non-hydrolyzing UDP-N-acetylglucosamine 2-epimerase n=1 Tax=Sphingomonas sp. TaxID=28214 RepID=UPI002E339D50|nr:UDP-N-acetylglucosamine 2-epimerase (non-hydrolyzing) [Sphingomonas sp.]HEX4695925.1 UDP-N-acetylglucosamine 2-epimerase (non-hydrolyzing) [Sphingomonas sp.]